MAGNGLKLSQGRVRLGSRKRFFTKRVVEHQNSFPREVVTAPNLSEFKKGLDNAFRHGVGFLGCPAQGQQLDSMILMGLFQLRIFYDSIAFLFFFLGVCSMWFF